VIVAFIALLIWQPIAALGDPLGIALFAVTIGGGALVLAHTSLHTAAGCRRPDGGLHPSSDRG
jgi:hypothetical protein